MNLHSYTFWFLTEGLTRLLYSLFLQAMEETVVSQESLVDGSGDTYATDTVIIPCFFLSFFLLYHLFLVIKFYHSDALQTFKESLLVAAGAGLSLVDYVVILPLVPFLGGVGWLWAIFYHYHYHYHHPFFDVAGGVRQNY